MKTRDLRELVELIVRFADVHPRWSGTYKAFRNDLLNVDCGSREDREFVVPMGTKGFTTYLADVVLRLADKGVDISVRGTLRHLLLFHIVKVGHMDVMPTVAST